MCVKTLCHCLKAVCLMCVRCVTCALICMRDMRGATCIMRECGVREYMRVSCGLCVCVWHMRGACEDSAWNRLTFDSDICIFLFRFVDEYLLT